MGGFSWSPLGMMANCAPEAAGTGVAAALYAHLQQIALDRGIGRLYVEASEPARRFFLKHGFQTIERRDFVRRGVLIHNYRMEKPLTAARP
jgi:putative acetyltransferase